MEMFDRVVRKALEFSLARFDWWLLVLLQAAGFFSVGWAFRKLGASPGLAYIPVFGFLFASLATTRLWLEIQSQYEDWEKLNKNVPRFSSVEFWRLSLVLGGTMVVFGAVEFILRSFVPGWTFRILATSLCLVYFLGVQLFWVIFRKGVRDSISLSLDLWLKRVQVPAVCSLVLMLGNSLAFYLAKTGLRPLVAGGFSDLGSSAKLWLLAMFFLLLSVGILVWLNNFLVIGFLEFVRTQKGKNQKAAESPAFLAIPGK